MLFVGMGQLKVLRWPRLGEGACDFLTQLYDMSTVALAPRPHRTDVVGGGALTTILQHPKITNES